MRCAVCRRRLLAPAYTSPAGWMLGPKCMEREIAAGRLYKWEAPKRKKARKSRVPVGGVRVLPGQLDLFQ